MTSKSDWRNILRRKRKRENRRSQKANKIIVLNKMKMRRKKMNCFSRWKKS